ncbi:DUF2884 family protein [Simiduia aestuariiviva]|uniref:DUF2884 family protein n=1 Tax=Simiduia aestuariiviva TaxID=1510459 RepID=A0A839UJR6_9GAMM|nr:DUF2884 family protein [Simiduia aestuariiviva]MBB3167011.1 hypothetical protein [Simiduia aestuariiviva]
MRVLGCMALGLALWLPTTAVVAGVDMGLKNCHVRFANDFSVKPSGVNSTQRDTVYVLKTDGEVRVNGSSVSLSSQQRSLVVDYTGGLQQFMPDMVAFISETLHTVGKVMGGALAKVFGADSEPAQKVRASLEASEARMAARQAEHPGEYHVVDQHLDILDDAFDADFERSIEEAVEASMGGVMTMLSAALFGGDGSFDERMASFGTKMESFGEQVERDMESVEPTLEKRGEALCDKAEAIEKMEYRLRETIPELAHYRLMDSRKKAREAARGGELRAD